MAPTSIATTWKREQSQSREGTSSPQSSQPESKPKARSRKSGSSHDKDNANDNKRKCVSTACIACRRRKSKCDGNVPACAACASVYGTECVYDPNSDHRRKGVYKKDIDNLKTRNSTLQTLVQAILNYPDSDVPDLIHEIRTTDNLDNVAENIIARDNGDEEDFLVEDELPTGNGQDDKNENPKFKSYLASRMGELRLGDGSMRYLGGTSNLLFLGPDCGAEDDQDLSEHYQQQANPVTSWTTVTNDPDLVMHLLNMYFTWHYTFFATLSKKLFWRDFLLGRPPQGTRRRTEYCTPLLVNVMLALGCHFTAHSGAREDPEDSATVGDHFFREAKRLILDEDELERPKLATVQALGLMSVREAGCGRENGGWAYSGMSFRMANDMGLSFSTDGLTPDRKITADEEEEDTRRITFWGGSFLFDKCWSNYLGRLPLFESSQNITVPKFEVFPTEDSDTWQPYTDSGFTQAHAQPSRVRAVALQISSLCEISGDIMKTFYHPHKVERASSKQTEVKRLSEIHTRLETWRRNLPKELEPKEGGLSSVLIMHMFFQLLYIHLFRPFLKYNQSTSPLPANVSPRKLCTQAASTISKLLRLYKRSHGLRQIVNVAVYIAHTACTVHLLNLPEKNARRDITHGVKHLEEIAEGWLCARRTLCVLSSQAQNWGIELPEEAATVLARTDAKFGYHLMKGSQSGSSPSHRSRQASPSIMTGSFVASPKDQWAWQQTEFPISTSELQPSMFNVEAANSQVAQTSPPLQQGLNTAGGYFAMPQNNQPGYGYNNTSQPFSSAPNVSQSIITSAPPPPQQIFQQQPRPQRPRASAEMFGDLESMLRGPDWWVKEETHMAHNFGNWNLEQPQQQQQQPQSQPQQQQQVQQRQPDQRSQEWALQNATESIPITSAPNGMTSNGMNAIAPLNAFDATSLLLDGNGAFGGFGTLANHYDENEWYT